MLPAAVWLRTSQYAGDLYSNANAGDGVLYTSSHSNSVLIGPPPSSAGLDNAQLTVGPNGIGVSGIAVVSSTLYACSGIYVGPGGVSSGAPSGSGGSSGSGAPSGSGSTSSIFVNGTSSIDQVTSSNVVIDRLQSTNSDVLNPGGSNSLVVRGLTNMRNETDDPSVTTLSVTGSVFLTGRLLMTSDASVKVDLSRLSNASAAVASLNGYRYRRVGDQQWNLGLLAQEVEAVLPELVRTDPSSGLKSVDYPSMVAAFVEAIKDLRGQVDDLSKRIDGASSS